ncbi:MAG TPA: phosphate signaling complex protein PhoU, partial [Dehalococcoidales bacterium]|nr:phosphate signaling complex protein PhoU [Dehalococcoidales bacterium]
DDQRIDQKRYEIEEKCIDLIVTQQPIASDMRIIIAVLNIIVDLERIGDHAEGTAKICILIGDQPPLKPLIDLPRMAEMTGSMLRRSLEAFIKHDAETASKICQEDDAIDNLYDQVFRELLTFMAEDPRTITRATRLIWVAHNLERSADRVTNIGERVIYVVTGRHDWMAGSRY